MANGKTIPKTCYTCGKQMELGLDPSIGKWRPFDNYAQGITHDCRTQQQSTVSQPEQQATNTLTADNVKEIIEASPTLTKISNHGATSVWMLEEFRKQQEETADIIKKIWDTLKQAPNLGEPDS